MKSSHPYSHKFCNNTPEVAEIVSHFTKTPSGRQIINRMIEKFMDNPSDFRAHQLESFGFCIDHSDGDWGTGLRGEPNN